MMRFTDEQADKADKMLAVIFLVIIVGAFVTGMIIEDKFFQSQPSEQDRGLAQPRVMFSPKGGVTEAVVGEINAAQREIMLFAYSFTSDPIEAALVAASKRGVKVQVIVDRHQVDPQGSAAMPLAQAGVRVLVDEKHAIMHNKVILIDSEIVITGSFNWTKQAETSNAENLLIIRSKGLFEKYKENWQLHSSHSVPLAPQP